MKGSFFSASFLIILGLALSQHLCPPPKLIEPCECTNPYWPVTYSCENISDKEALTDAFNRSLDYPVHALAIRKAIFLYLPTALLKAKNLTILLISHSSMSAIFNEPIGGPYDMQMFQVIESSISRGFEWEQFKGVNIGQIQIERTEVKRIGASFVESIEPSATEITFDAAKIAHIHKNAFSKLNQLTTIAMPHNRIKAVQRSMFANPSNIRIFDFSWNKISDLPDDIFSGMPTLTDVFLEGNQLKTFPARTWEKLIDSTLHQVALADNPIVCDCGLKWYTNKRRSLRVTGKCAEPSNLKNYNLNQLTAGDFHYCPK